MSSLLDKIEEAKTIIISGHLRPDGDCVGSTTAIYYYILENYPDKKVYYILDPISENILKVIDEPERYNHEIENDTADLFISLDSASKDRLGQAEEFFDKALFKFVIDHHKTNTLYGDINIVEAGASSAAEVLFKLLDENKISEKVAKSLYLGIVHDTGVFKYSSTHKSTMEIAGLLLEKGVDTAKIIDETFYAKSWKQNKVLAKALNNADITSDGFIAYTVLSIEDLYELQATSMDTDGIVEQLRLTNGVEIAMFLREDAKDMYKVSLRAKEGLIDVSTIAVKNNGGGHKMAAGFNVYGPKDKVIKELLKDINDLRGKIVSDDLQGIME